MDNINLNHLLEVATFQEIGDAFGKSKQLVNYYHKKTGDIPNDWRYEYLSKQMPNESKEARKLYRRVLKHLRENGVNL